MLGVRSMERLSKGRAELMTVTGIDILVDSLVLGIAFAAGAKASILLTVALTIEVLFLGLIALLYLVTEELLVEAHGTEDRPWVTAMLVCFLVLRILDRMVVERISSTFPFTVDTACPEEAGLVIEDEDGTRMPTAALAAKMLTGGTVSRLADDGHGDASNLNRTVTNTDIVSGGPAHRDEPWVRQAQERRPDGKPAHSESEGNAHGHAHDGK